MIPQLARTVGPKYSLYPCYCQPKLNGVRALYQNGVFQSRDEKLWSKEVLAHLHEVLTPLRDFLGPLILDGELYVHGWRLQRINAAIAVNRKHPTVDTSFIQYHVFDVVDNTKNFSDRWFELYQGIINLESPLLHAVATNHCESLEEMQRYFHAATEHGYEGIMLRPNGPYTFGPQRSKTLWKHKQWQDGEFLCIGVTQGEGKANIGMGAMVCETKPPIFGPVSTPSQFKVGTGFDDSERIHFMSHPPIGKLIKVRYLELTADGIPFNPSFLCVMQ